MRKVRELWTSVTFWRPAVSDPWYAPHATLIETRFSMKIWVTNPFYSSLSWSPSSYWEAVIKLLEDIDKTSPWCDGSRDWTQKLDIDVLAGLPKEPRPNQALDTRICLTEIEKMIQETESAISVLQTQLPCKPQQTIMARPSTQRKERPPVISTKIQRPAFAGVYFAYPEDPQMELPWLTAVMERVNARWLSSSEVTVSPRLIFFVVLVYDRVSHFLDSQTETFFSLTGSSVSYSLGGNAILLRLHKSGVPADFNDGHIRSTFQGRHCSVTGSFTVSVPNTGQQAMPVFNLSEPDALVAQIETLVGHL